MGSDHESRLAFAHRLADAAGAAIRPHFRKNISIANKGAVTGKAFDPVTAADRAAEAAIRQLIRASYPGDGIVGEEFGAVSGASGFDWVIDPIDGTRAFLTGQLLWGTLIALSHRGKPVLGVLDQPILRERFVGANGRTELISPAGRAPLSTRSCKGLDEAILSTTHPWDYFDKTEQDAFARLAGRARMTRFGGDCYGYALLAMGFIDVIVEADLHVWDVAALIPIVEGAGGCFTDWQGEPARRGGRVIAAGDARVHAEAMAVLANK